MPEYSSHLKDLFRASETRSAELEALLDAPNDVVALVLRGHLILEELLFTACSAHCQSPEHLKGARLRFPQLVNLLRSLEKIPSVPERFWGALLELNALRNALAHVLEPADMRSRIAKLAGTVLPRESAAHLSESPTEHEALALTLRYLIGGFEVVAVWHEALEALLRARALENSPKV